MSALPNYTDPNTPQSFTVTAQGRLSVLTTDVKVFKVFRFGIDPQPKGEKYTAVWDTGATRSVITQSVVDALDLKPIGFTQVHHAQGVTKKAPEYLVNIGLPNHVMFTSVRATKGILSGIDVLIGMDIIGSGDFAVTYFQGKTRFSFRMPSCEAIDFVKKRSPQAQTKSPGRNDPCPCGSGKKSKHCCGSPK